MFILHCELRAFAQADYDIFTEVAAFKSKVNKKKSFKNIEGIYQSVPVYYPLCLLNCLCILNDDGTIRREKEDLPLKTSFRQKSGFLLYSWKPFRTVFWFDYC